MRTPKLKSPLDPAAACHHKERCDDKAGGQDLNTDELLALAHELADVAEVETLRYFRSDELEASSKAAVDFDPVTLADRRAEQAMRAVIERRRPDDGILGEELGQKASRSGLTWVLDPIDGTRGYISGTPTWGTLIALNDGTCPVFGLIAQPYIGERWIGGLGQAQLVTRQQVQRLKTTSTQSLCDATLFSTFPEVGCAEEYQAFARVARRCKLVRYGMDCYAYGLLASGQIDLIIEAGLQPYDIQAPIAVIEAAGGVVSDWSGKPACHGGQILAAANQTLHEAALACLRDSASEQG